MECSDVSRSFARRPRLLQPVLASHAYRGRQRCSFARAKGPPSRQNGHLLHKALVSRRNGLCDSTTNSTKTAAITDWSFPMADCQGTLNNCGSAAGLTFACFPAIKVEKCGLRRCSGTCLRASSASTSTPFAVQACSLDHAPKL
jgi:hypothetical protein